jgi:hypothetical protein
MINHVRVERRKSMRRTNLFIAGIVLVGGLGLATTMNRVTATVEEAGHREPAIIEAVDGTSLYRITLSERGAERVGLETAPVAEEAVSGKIQKSIPYSAVIYDANGGTWAYTTDEDLVFVRDEISVDRIDGDTAYLSDGPAAGTEVVTVGAAELVGAERYKH